MAIIVEYHVNADQYPVGNTAISAGMVVSLDASGNVIPATAVDLTPIGIAGDSFLTAEGKTTATSAQVVIGAEGSGTRYTSNRVSDFYNETAASQKISVYNGGGKFWVSEDLFNAGRLALIAPGSILKVDSAAGKWEDQGDHTNICAVAVGANTAYSSGVPGSDTEDGSISLGNYVPLILRL